MSQMEMVLQDRSGTGFIGSEFLECRQDLREHNCRSNSSSECDWGGPAE